MSLFYSLLGWIKLCIPWSIRSIFATCYSNYKLLGLVLSGHRHIQMRHRSVCQYSIHDMIYKVAPIIYLYIMWTKALEAGQSSRGTSELITRYVISILIYSWFHNVAVIGTRYLSTRYVLLGPDNRPIMKSAYIARKHIKCFVRVLVQLRQDIG